MADGEIISINKNLENDASLVNSSPEDEGWMVEIKVSNPSQLDKLMSLEQYKESCNH